MQPLDFDENQLAVGAARFAEEVILDLKRDDIDVDPIFFSDVLYEIATLVVNQEAVSYLDRCLLIRKDHCRPHDARLVEVASRFVEDGVSLLAASAAGAGTPGIVRQGSTELLSLEQLVKAILRDGEAACRLRVAALDKAIVSQQFEGVADHRLVSSPYPASKEDAREERGELLKLLDSFSEVATALGCSGKRKRGDSDVGKN